MDFLFINIFLAIFCLILIVAVLINTNKYNKTIRDVNKISLAIKRVRYGDIYIRVKNLNNKEFETAANRLFETIYDREMMIKEYQTTLAKKNLSLEKIIKQEKQLQLFKEEFAATLTHDMKVPVIAELNSINYLLEGRFGELNEKQSEILNLMKTSNNDLKELIENMLEIYKLEQKDLNLNITEQNFNDFINTVIAEMTPIINTSEHIITSDTEETKEIFIEFDKMQLKRVIKNLIQNALSYSPNKSEITIKTYISMDCIKFVISNQSIGMSKEDLSKIFNKYYSLHSKYKSSGTGLGLYLSQQIAIAHNGKIEADCSEDGLTSFTLTLPLKH